MDKLPKKNGRPKIFNKPEELDAYIDAYNKYCEEKEEVFTAIGLCCFIGINKDTFTEYQKDPNFSVTIKKAQTLAERALVTGSLMGKYNPSVSIFLLKNNHGYKDKQEQEISGGVEIKYYAPKKDENL